MIHYFIFVMQVDKHIRKLDSDLQRFEQELKEKGNGKINISVLLLKFMYMK